MMPTCLADRPAPAETADNGKLRATPDGTDYQ
jgi:hypothetical protein